ncbi:hypothetical protein BKE30_06350 [Alkanindiges hydrocarboniclasticus]|uniref:DUF11 domain-containing protein n=2 Tax=Alkanindiges hydrocarboniclasticus TaxID=1907941 RepID=A0A1S8CW91_9GAMM|nr:hypothetical protein BKE30_06350 [Alkanindiges hydrocarboniclasticus]
MFGGTVTGSSNVVTQATVYSPLNSIGAPTNSNFAATLQNAPSGCSNGSTCSSGTTGGIDTASNYGSGMFAATKGLIGSATNGRYKIGSITVTFNRAVTNPILQVAGLGGTTGNLGLSAEFDLVSNSSLNNSIVMSRLAGSKELTVNGGRISNNASAISATTGSGGASGSIYLQGRRITTLTFDVYIRGDGGDTSWDSTNSVAGDRFFFGVSSIEAENDLSITKTQRTDTSSGSFVGTQLDVVQGSPVQYRLILANSTSIAVSGATYSDIIPAAITGVTVVSTTPSSGTTCTPSLSGNTISGTYNGPAGSTCTIIMQGTASTVGLVTNTATLVENSTDPDLSNNTSSVNTNIIAATNLAITKTGTSSVKAGQPVNYTIKVWNKGPAAVSDAVMTDVVPNNISGVYLRCTATGTATCGTHNSYVSGSNTRTATGINLPVDATGNTNYVTYTISGLAYQTGSFSNTATISSAAVPESNNSDNSASQATTITTDAPVTTGSPANQCMAAQATNVISPLAFTGYSDNSITQTANLTVNSAGTGYGIATNGAITVNGRIAWSYGIPRITGATLTIYINGTAYAVMTTVGASSNGDQATWTALNGASITPSTVALGSYGNVNTSVPFTLTLPTSVTSVTSGYAEFKNISPTGSSTVAGDDIGIAVDSILQCQKPIVKIAKISNGGTDTFGFTGLSNLSNSSGTAVTTDSVTTTAAATARTSTQTNYATANNTAVGITESAVSGYSLTAASCTDANSAVTGNTGSFGNLSGTTLTIPAANIKYGANLTCTFTNTKQRNLTLRKIWVNARINDAATITATGLNSFVSTANTASETDTAAAQAVTVGSTVTLGENISTGAGYYNAALSCTRNSDGAAVSVTGTNLTMPDADVTCGYTNSRKTANLTLQKIWANAKINDAVTVTATGLTSLSAVANTASETDAAAGQTVYAGDSITLGESFTVGSASNYNGSLACSGNATALSGNVLTVNTADNAITCSYTNSRIAQQLSLSKLWQNAVSGHTATATTTGGSNNPTFSSTSTGNNTTAGSAVTVYAGDVVTLPVETLGGGASTAQYNSTLACSGGTALASGAVARSITISNSTTATVCTYTNARKSATLTLAKIWSAGSIAGNTATVSSSGFGNNASSGTSTATAAGNTTTGTSVAVYAGESGTISETFGTGTASNYTATLACSGNSTALSGNTLTINPADTAINCSYTNTVIGADLAIDKTGTSGVTQGNTVSYSIKVWNKGPATASSSTFTDTVPTALTNVSWSCSASGSAVCGTASGSGNAISVTTGALPVNASSTAPTTGSYLTFTVTGTAGTAGNISNTASIAVTSGTDPVSSNNSSSASTSISAPAAIIADTPQKEARFVISPNLPTIYRGQAGTQLVTISNQGPDNATGTVATFKLRTQTGITVTSVKVAGGANCSLSSGEWSCPVGSVANGGSFQLEVGYDTTTSAALGTAIQADIRVSSNEFNPGSGVGETLYKVWGSNTTNEIRPNGAFWAGFKGPQGATPASGYDDETTAIINAWPLTQASPTGSYLVSAVSGANNNIYAASSTNASPMINRIITSMSTDPARSVTLPSLDSTSAGDNRRAWEFRTGVFVPQATNVTLCIGNTSVGIDDGAYIMLDGTSIGTQDSYAPGGYVSATVAFTAGYHSLNYRILNQNTYGGSSEVAQGLYGAIGILYNGTCNVAGYDAWVNTQIPASINIVEKQVVSITGQVFEDNSGSTAVSSNAYNGVKNTGEAGIAGSSVSITNCNSSSIATTTTDANGDYSFSLSPTDLPAGNFCIAQTNLTGYSSVSGTTGYSRATDRIVISNTAATSYGNHNFGDARLTALLSEDGQQTINAGGVADYPHRLTAQSVLTISSLNQTTSQQPANSSDQSWQAVVYRDSNCNGKVDSGESLFSQSLPLSLKNAEEVCLVQRVYAPATASMGAQHIGQLQASFSVTLADNSQITGSSLQRQDTTLLGSAGLTMQKGVRSVASCPSTAADTSGFSVQNQVQSGGYLEYEITYRNNTTKNLVDVSLKDSVPTGTVYKSVSCLSSPSGSCNANHNNGALLWQTGGTLLPNQQGKVRFCVQVP